MSIRSIIPPHCVVSSAESSVAISANIKEQTISAEVSTLSVELTVPTNLDSKKSLSHSLPVPHFCPSHPLPSSSSTPSLCSLKNSTQYSSTLLQPALLYCASSHSSIPPSVSKTSEANLSIALAMGAKTPHPIVAAPWSLRTVLFSLMLLLVWMISSILSTLTNKTLMDVFPYPVTLSLIHLFSSVIVDLLIIFWRRLPLLPFRKELFLKCLPVAATIDFQKTFTYVSYGMVPASLTHTAKASSPVFSVMLSKLMYNRVPTGAICASLVPITVGVILSAVTEINFVFFGFVAAVLASLASVLNSLYTKAALTHASCPDPLILHLYTCVLAVLMLLPYALFKDAAPILRDIMASSSSSSRVISALTSPSSLSTAVSLSVNEPIARASSLLGGSDAPSGSAFPTDMILFSLSMHYLQNISSVYYLNGVTVLTHQVAQTLKRLVVIVSTVIYFHNPVSPLNGVGMLLAIIGFFFYGLAKSKPAREPKHSHEHAVDDQVIITHSTDGTTRMRHAHHDKTRSAADDGLAIKIAHDRDHANGVHHAIEMNDKHPIQENLAIPSLPPNGRRTPQQDEGAFLL